MAIAPMSDLSRPDLESDGMASPSEDPPRAPVADSVEPAASSLVTVITPSDGAGVIDVGELWRFRDLLYFLAWRDVKVRYKQTALGAAWAVLQPAMMMVVFTLFFQKLAGNKATGDIPYPLFAYCGLLPWTFFATAISGAGNSVIGSERIITKIYFPRLSIPFAAVAATVVDFVVALSLLAGLMLWHGVPPSHNIWLAPLVYAMIVLSALGVGTFLSALNVSYRDFRYVIPFLVQVWMFATPSVYMPIDSSAKPSGIASWVLALNPLSGLIAAFRAAVVGGPIPWSALVGSSLCAVVCFVAGCLYFRRVEDKFADII